MKNKIIAGNWKMNNNRIQAEALINELIPLVADTKNTVIICVPFTDLCKAVKLTKGTNIRVGAQNCHWKESGAYTGEIAPSMLTELGVEYVVIGHSERRSYFGETNETVLLRKRWTNVTAAIWKKFSAAKCWKALKISRRKSLKTLS